MYGKRLVTVPQLYELQREVNRAASKAREADPKHREKRERNHRASMAAVVRWR